jgi:hypothetical protein
MTAFSQKVPNGKYVVNLHFAETYQGITAAGQRIFSFTVGDKEFKDFDIWEKAGGLRKAYVESVPVEVKDGELKISFERKVENPAIKAIEILPKEVKEKDAKPIRVNAGASESFTDSKKQVWSADQGFVGGRQSALLVWWLRSAGQRWGWRWRRQTRRIWWFRRRPFGCGVLFRHRDRSEGVRQYVQLTSAALVGVSADKGEMLWQYVGLQRMGNQLLDTDLPGRIGLRSVRLWGRRWGGEGEEECKRHV